MDNDILIIAAALIDLLLVLFAFRLGKEWVYVAMGVNLILVSTFGFKLIGVSPYDFITNAGNVYYAVVFFAMHLLTEHLGGREARRAVWVGTFAVFLYVVIGQMTLYFRGIDQILEVNEAIRLLFGGGVRLALASILSFIVVQHLNIWLYDILRAKTNGRHLWLRDTATNVLAQLLDSALFFSLAFSQLLPGAVLVEVMVVGFVLKVLIGLLGTPLLYWSLRLERSQRS